MSKAVPADQQLNDALAQVSSVGKIFRQQSCSLEEAITQADKLLSELKTSDLSPRQYYDLNLRVSEELRYLQIWFVEMEKRNEVKMVDLYQRVQYVSSVVPRLYLLCTVGAAYVSLSGSPAKEVMRDMLEMCKCVQHPMRGLFLRNYLSNLTKDKLDLLGGPKDRCEFVLQNFSEMTRLWVRMQPPKKTIQTGEEQQQESEVELRRKKEIRDRREVERKQLCQLIGSNLHRLSESVEDLDIYETMILPRVLDIVISSGDSFAQTFLCEVLCNVIPNKFQIATLKTFLSTICGPDMNSDADFKQVLSSLMNRLADEIVTRSKASSEEEDDDTLLQTYSPTFIFDTLYENIRNINCRFEDFLSIHVELLRFQSRIDAKRLDRIDLILGSICESLEKREGEKIQDKEEALLVALLKTPLETTQNGDVLGILQLSRFPKLQGFLGFDHRRATATTLLKALINSSDKIEDIGLANRLFEFIEPLLTISASEEDDAKIDSLLARVTHKFYHEDPNELFRLLGVAKENLEKSIQDRRLVKTLLPIAFRNLELVRKPGFSQIRGALQLVHSIGAQLSTNECSPQVKDMAARLFTYAALAADKVPDESVAYECLVSAFSIYEEQADSKLQTALVPFFIGTVQTMVCFSKDNLETLQAKTALYAAQLLKKTDQSRQVALSSHLFWSVQPERTLREGEVAPIPGKNGKRALECLQRASKTAESFSVGINANRSQSTALFVEILNQYIYFLQTGADKIKPQYIMELITLIKEQISTANPPVDILVESFFRRTMIHLRKLAAKGGKFAEFSAATDGTMIEPVTPSKSELML